MKKTWLITYLNDVSEVVSGDRMVANGGVALSDPMVYHFWDDTLSHNGPFLVVNAEVVSSIRLQPAEIVSNTP